MNTQTLIGPAHALIASAAPDRPALVFADQTLTHSQVFRLGQAFAKKMADSGIGPGAQINLDCDEPAVILATLLGASWLGAQMLPKGDLSELPAPLQVTHRLSVALPDMTAKAGDLLIDHSWSPALTGPWDGQASSDAHEPFLCVHTSGTTGMPKFLWLSQSQIVARSLAVSDEFTAGSRHILLFAAYSRPFLARALAALLNGSTLVFDLAPADWSLAGIAMVSGARAHLKAVMEGPCLTPKCPKVEVIGSRLPEQEAALLLRSFDLVDDTYGSSETSKAYSTIWNLDDTRTPISRSGRRDSKIELTGADGQPVEQGDDGIVRLRNSYMAQGYVNDAAATEASFQDGWFYPGDVAWQDDNGRLHFRDRTDHIVNIKGEKVNAYSIDLILRSVDGIDDGVCFRNPKPDAADELFAFVVYAPNANRLQSIATARHRIGDKLGKHLVPRVIQGVAGIPRKTDGRPDRKACADLVLSIFTRDPKLHEQ